MSYVGDMIRLFVPHPLLADTAFPLDDAQSRYLSLVMRRAVGDEVEVFNGKDGAWVCRLDQVTKRHVILCPKTQTSPQTEGPDLVLLMALVKRGPLETVIEKATELGVSEIWLVQTDRTNADRIREDRLRAIAIEAAEQTGRLNVPLIRSPARLDRCLDTWSTDRRLIFCDEAGDSMPMQAALGAVQPGPWAVLIGPEGGFSPAERARIRGLEGAVPVSLGPRILRADTAAISALTLWQSALGDWRG